MIIFVTPKNSGYSHFLRGGRQQFSVSQEKILCPEKVRILSIYFRPAILFPFSNASEVSETPFSIMSKFTSTPHHCAIVKQLGVSIYVFLDPFNMLHACRRKTMHTHTRPCMRTYKTMNVHARYKTCMIRTRYMHVMPEHA